MAKFEFTGYATTSIFIEIEADTFEAAYEIAKDASNRELCQFCSAPIESGDDPEWHLSEIDGSVTITSYSKDGSKEIELSPNGCRLIK